MGHLSPRDLPCGLEQMNGQAASNVSLAAPVLKGSEDDQPPHDQPLPAATLSSLRMSSLTGLRFLHAGVVAPIDQYEPAIGLGSKAASVTGVLMTGGSVAGVSVTGGSVLPLDHKRMTKDVVHKLSEYDTNNDGELDEGEVSGA